MADKAGQKARNAAAAGRMKHLRAVKFETEGFPSNGPVPSLAAARTMANHTKRNINNVPHLIVSRQTS